MSRAVTLGKQVLARGKRVVNNRVSPEADWSGNNAEKLWTGSKGKLLLF